jgi:DNA-directed RNA polymerase subunit RPC12/RpoP
MPRIEFSDNEDYEDIEHTGRTYYCTKCETQVQSIWHGPGTFSIGCAHDTIPIVPQLGQDETPDYWRVRRPECCRDKDATELTKTRFEDGQDYECSECGAAYTREGYMVGEPTNLEESE